MSEPVPHIASEVLPESSPVPVPVPVPAMVAIPAPGTRPAPRGSALEIWWSRIDVGNLPEPVRAELAAVVDARRLERLARYRRAEDRDRGLAVHALLRRLLAAITGTSPEGVKIGTFCVACGRNDHGKPFLDTGDSPRPVEINLSHAGRIVVVALAAPGVDVGVDVEQDRTVDWKALRGNVFTDDEWEAAQARADAGHRHLATWARKESSVKASGHGLSLPLRAVATLDRGSGGEWSAILPSGAGRAAGWDLDLGPDVAAAVAVLRADGWPDPPVLHQVGIG